MVAGEKGGLPQLDQMIGKQAQELVFVLGSQAYDPGMTRYWLDHLTRYPFFRFVVLQQNGGAFFGMFDARTLTTALAQGSGWSDFVNEVASANTASLQRLPGFLGADAAVNLNTDKEAVLRRMQQLRATTLPVTGPAGRLVGIVDQSSVLGSLVLDINTRLKAM